MNFLLTLIYEGLENKYPQFKLDTGKSNIIFHIGQHTHINSNVLKKEEFLYA